MITFFDSQTLVTPNAPAVAAYYSEVFEAGDAGSIDVDFIQIAKVPPAMTYSADLETAADLHSGQWRTAATLTSGHNAVTSLSRFVRIRLSGFGNGAVTFSIKGRFTS
jgi:hypothetical protein